MQRLSHRSLALCALLLSALAAQAGPPRYPPHFRDYGPPSYYGYPLDDRNPGYFGGGRYREYYSYGRGYGLANFPDSLPWYHDPRWPRGIPVGAVPSKPAECHVIVWVPAAAEVWFDDAKTTQPGPAREFISPPLPEDRTFTYVVRARWVENGREVEQVQHVDVTGGQRVVVRFPSAP